MARGEAELSSGIKGELIMRPANGNGESSGPKTGLFQHGGRDLGGLDFEHAAEVDGAFPEETGTALDVAADDGVTVPEWTGEGGLGRAEDGDDGHAEMGGEVHGAGVVGQEEMALQELVHEFLQSGFADEIPAFLAKASGDDLADRRIPGHAEERPGEFAIFGDGLSGFEETLGGVALGGAVFRAGAKADPER